MTVDRNTLARQAAIREEVAIQRQVIELVAFGARPGLINDFLGRRISLGEIKRIFKLTSPRRQDRAGRPADLRKIRNFGKSVKAVLGRLLQDYVSITGKEFDPVDSLLATWRVHAEALWFHKAATPVDIEILMVAIRLLSAAQIELVHCVRPQCEAPNVLSEFGETSECCACKLQFRRLDARAVQGSERWSSNPAYAAYKVIEDEPEPPAPVSEADKKRRRDDKVVEAAVPQSSAA